MKKLIAIILAMLICLLSVSAVSAENAMPYDPDYVDTYTAEDMDESRIVYVFISDKHLTVSRGMSGQLKVAVDAETYETMEKLGFTSLKVQRKNGSSWITDAEVTNEFDYSTDSFSYNETFSYLYSFCEYRVQVTLRARRAAGEVQDLTITSASIICH